MPVFIFLNPEIISIGFILPGAFYDTCFERLNGGLEGSFDLMTVLNCPAGFLPDKFPNFFLMPAVALAYASPSFSSSKSLKS